MENQGKKLIYESPHSQIYRVIDSDLKISKILKQIRGEYPPPEVVTRFQHEYELTRKLGIEKGLSGVIRVDSLRKENNTWVITMEDFGGESLAFYLEESLKSKQEIKLSELLSLAIQICEFVEQIHQQGIIHKDLNPSNLIWNSESKQIKLIDFGISEELLGETTQIRAPEKLEGTLAYISPEQTGRINRHLDVCSDLYSLGVTFYQLFTGELPFTMKDPLELVHAHLALTPKPAHEINRLSNSQGNRSQVVGWPEIPEILSLILNKLMSKSAEERYQSAHGLQMDLQRCLDSLLENKIIAHFELGQEDQLEQFRFPHHLFGREKELKILKQALEKSCQGGDSEHWPEVIWIKGDSGVGKSALVAEVRQWVLQKNGHFVTGKFDLANLDLPYFIMHAFQGLIQQLLAETREKLSFWKEKLVKNLGKNGQLILDMIPEMELILGSQSPVCETPKIHVPPAQALNRFHSTFRTFVRTFASPDHVFVLFLDDLQWADQASLDLLFTILLDQELRGFLFLGTYRYQEVDQSTPFYQFLEKLNRGKQKQQALLLHPLKKEGITAMLEETFLCSGEQTQLLSKILLEKTKGNPFFLKQFLAHLVKKGVIHFDRQQKSWLWKVEEIEEMEISKNVAILLTEKIQHLSPLLQHCLQAASCIGSEFDLDSLEWFSQQSILEQLNELTRTGFLVSLSDHRYSFVHDQIQQAAYVMISEEERPKKHKTIGQHLLEKLSEEELELRLFDVVAHWNEGRSLLEKRDEIEQFILLNYKAGKKAKQEVAYGQAFIYFQIAIQSLTSNIWARAYPQVIDLHLEAAEVASFTQNEREMRSWIKVVVDKDQDSYDCIRAETIRVQSYLAFQKNKEAIDLALSSLQRIEISFPKKINPLHFHWEYLKIQQKIQSKSYQELIQLARDAREKKGNERGKGKKRGKEQDQQEVLKLMTVLSSSAYYSKPELFPLIAFKIIELSLGEYGFSSQVIYPYVVLSMVHYRQGNFQEGKRMLKLSSDLLQLFQADDVKAKQFLMRYFFLGPLHHSLASCVEKMEEGAESAVEVGDFEFADYHFGLRIGLLYFQKVNLSNLKKELKLALGKTHGEHALYHSLLIYGEVFSNWEGEPSHVPQLFGDYLKDFHLERFKERKEVNVLFDFFFHKMQLAYEFGKNELALEALLEARKYLGASHFLFMHMGYYHCFEALILLEGRPLDDQLERPSDSQLERPSDSQREKLLNWYRIKKGRRKLKKWAGLSPNFKPLWFLVEGEVHRIQGKIQQAQEFYREAIKIAQKHHFLRLEALANDLAGRCYLANSKEDFPLFARTHLRQAHHCYSIWGATAKVKQLEFRYPQLKKMLEEEKLPEQRKRLNANKTITASYSDQRELNDLDWKYLTNAYQEISKKIDLESLCKILLDTMLQCIGAQRGVLLIDIAHEFSESIWKIKAKSEKEKGAQYFSEGISVEESEQISLGVFHYTLRTPDNQEPLVLGDASCDDRFQNDPYVLRYGLKSVLCLPILQKGKPLAIAYFENNLHTKVFVEKHSKVLKILALQAAVSLENERKNLEVQETQTQLIQAEKMAGLGLLIAGVGHEINNPLAALSQHASNLDRGLHKFHKELVKMLKKPKQEELQFFQKRFDPFFQMLQMIQNGNLQLQRIVGNLQNFSHMDHSDMEVGDPIQALENTLQLVQPQYLQKILLECNFLARPKTLCFLGALNQVFLNLVVNACQAILVRQMPSPPPGKLRIESKIDENRLCICFQDNGCGMSKEIQKKIFNPFFSTKPRGQGTGLGMHISRKVIEQQHHGEIKVNSTLGEGSMIMLYLPIKLQEEEKGEKKGEEKGEESGKAD